MNWEIIVDQQGLGLVSHPIYVEAPNIVEAIKIAEEHVIEETSARPDDVFTTSAKLADAQRIIKAKTQKVDSEN